MKYRKKPVVIEAVQWTGENLDEIFEFAKGCDRTVVYPANRPEGLIITTLEGDYIVSIGDWIIKGVQGELYPCKPDIFAATYDAVQDENDKPALDDGIYLSAILVKDGVASRTKRYMSAKKFAQILMKYVADTIPDLLTNYWRNTKYEHADM